MVHTRFMTGTIALAASVDSIAMTWLVHARNIHAGTALTASANTSLRATT